MTPYPLAINARAERDVLAGLAQERHAALKLYPYITADLFAAHPTHPYIFGTLRRLHLDSRGSCTVEVVTGPDHLQHLERMIDGFIETFDAAYPDGGGGWKALALLRECIRTQGLLWYQRVAELLELRERRRLCARVEAHMTPQRSLAELEKLHHLAVYLGTTDAGPIGTREEELDALGISVVPWAIPIEALG